jgi:hypothetical protein
VVWTRVATTSALLAALAGAVVPAIAVPSTAQAVEALDQETYEAEAAGQRTLKTAKDGFLSLGAFYAAGYADEYKPVRFRLDMHWRVWRVFLGFQIGGGWGAVGQSVTIPGTATRNFDDLLITANVSLKFGFDLAPENSWVSPYIGVAPGVLATVQTVKDKVSPSIAAVSAERGGRVQLGAVLAPFFGIRFFPNSPVHFYLEGRYDMVLPDVNKTVYQSDFYQQFTRNPNVPLQSSGFQMGGGIVFAW